MLKVTKDIFFLQRDHWLLLRGLVYLFILSTPLIGFVSIMGAAGPNSPGFLYTVGVILGFMFEGTFAFLLIFKLIDSLLMRGLATKTFSIFSIILGSLLFSIYFNVYEDNLYQVKQGNYDITVVGLVIVIGFWLFTAFVGQIRIFGKK